MTTALVIRYRYHIVTRRAGGEERALLAEDCRVIAFEGIPGHGSEVRWLGHEEAEKLLQVRPDESVTPEDATYHLERVLSGFNAFRGQIDGFAKERGQEILAAHRRVRTASQQTHVTYRVEAEPNPDVLAAFVYIPVVR